MKKIALLLAMVMLLVCVLTACNGTTEESKADTQSTANSTDATESKEAGESKAPADESEDQGEESVEPEESEDPIEPAKVGELISVDKPYTTSQLFRQNSNYEWDEDGKPAYDDEDGKSLTDGIFDPGDSSYTNVVWAGFSANCPDYKENGYSWIILDLEEMTDISLISLTVGTSALTSGIGADGFTVTFLVSEDGENWTKLGSVAAVDDSSVNFTNVEMATNVSAQYVQVQMMRGGWMFVSELSVYDVAADDVADESVAE